MVKKYRSKLPNLSESLQKGRALTEKIFKQQVKEFVNHLDKFVRTKYQGYITLGKPYFAFNKDTYYKADISFDIDDRHESGYIQIDKDGISIYGPSTVPISERAKFKNISSKRDFNRKFKIAVESVVPK